MKIGLKIVPQTTKESVDQIINYVDFIEIYAKIGNEYSWLKEYGLPMVIHCEHSKDNIVLCNPKKKEKNLKAINWAKYLANKFHSNKIIIHPGYKENSRCSIKYLIDFLKEHYDGRFLIETMPFLVHPKKGQLFCHDLNDVKLIVQQCNIGFCLDFNHSIGSAIHRNENWKDFVKKLINLNPKHFHISDVNISKGDEVHLNLFEGQVDFNSLKTIIPKDAWITLETPPDRKKQINSIIFLKQI